MPKAKKSQRTFESQLDPILTGLRVTSQPDGTAGSEPDDQGVLPRRRAVRKKLPDRQKVISRLIDRIKEI